jgi:pimeloyl-ACP methyl ester carboxylesterase
MIEPETYTLTNRRGQTFYGHLYKAQKQQGFAVIQHGFAGAVAEEHTQAMIAAYLDNDYTVLAPDCTNSFNDADGSIEASTMQSHLRDLEDAIAWAENQDWYKQPFALAGHSLGGFAVLLYAESNPQKIELLFPAAAALNGPLLEEAFAKYLPEEYHQCKEYGWDIKECSYKDGVYGYRYWRWFESMHDYDALAYVDRLTMPVLLIVGEQDEPCPPEHQQKLYDALPGPKEMHIIGDADHCYQPKISEMQTLLENWLQKQKSTTADAG